MAILNFQRPDKVIMIESNKNYGKFEFRPLEPGFGITIGNAIRRILLSSLEGIAITSIRIDGVDHEFSTVSGVVEDVIDIILNLKKIRFKRTVNDVNQEKVRVEIFNQDKFLAGDINKSLTCFEVINKDLVICNLDKATKFVIEMNIERGRGYVPAEENKDRNTQILGYMPIDAIYTPIVNVKYEIENYRVEQKTDYERLILEITTDGSISPKDSLKEAAKILIQHFMLFSDEKITLEDTVTKSVQDDFDEAALHMRQLLKTKLIDLDLSVRALNCLKAAELETLADLVALSKQDLLKFRNFGKKSLAELEALLSSKNLSFGMNLSKYKLDKE